MPRTTFITAQLRESAPYLQDAGFRETAKLLLAAAAEIEMLRSLMHQSTPHLDTRPLRTNENDIMSRTTEKIS